MKLEDKNIAFYNEIADEYDTILDNDQTNSIIRRKVRDKLISVVKSGCVLDFGGGTGLDLGWLIENKYKVIFCEPSPGMRQIAIDRNQNSLEGVNIEFLGNEKADFTTWHDKPPFSIQTEAILSNFAAINCIAEIELLFSNLAQVIKPGGHFIALVLQFGYKKTRWWKFKEFIRRHFYNEPLVLMVQFKSQLQTVHLYTSKEIKKAAGPYFKIISQEPLFEFTLLHLKKT
jgi:SAM-dependent methyltransferase